MDPITPDRVFLHQLRVEKGDTVKLTAISTTDDWHEIRHSLLNQTYIVDMVPAVASPHGEFNYRNWVRATLLPVGKSGNPIKIQGRSSFHFARIQLAKVNPIIPVVFPVRVERMLLNINAELNNKPKILHTPLDPYDAKAWFELYFAGKKVQARRLDGGDGRWYRAGRATFGRGLQREFRLKEQ